MSTPKLGGKSRGANWTLIIFDQSFSNPNHGRLQRRVSKCQESGKLTQTYTISILTPKPSILSSPTTKRTKSSLFAPNCRKNIQQWYYYHFQHSHNATTNSNPAWFLLHFYFFQRKRQMRRKWKVRSWGSYG